MTRALVGHSGFVGSNLRRQADFHHFYNSRNIADIAGRRYETMVVTAVPASMWLANNHPAQDLANIDRLYQQLTTVEARQVVLISTIAVYADPAAAPDEASEDAYENDKPYGRHRRQFEEMLAARFSDLLILRLPALFGPGLAKNFIFDLLHPIPSFLPREAMDRVLEGADVEGQRMLAHAFAFDKEAGMWRFDRAGFGHGIAAEVVEALMDQAAIGARNFTNSDSQFQFYNLGHLWSDIERALGAGISCLNLATQPLSAGQVAQQLTGRLFESHQAPLVRQDMRTGYAHHWRGPDNYLYDASQVLDELAAFFQREKAMLGT